MSIQGFYNAAKGMEFARDFQFQVRTLGPFTENDLLYLQTAVLPSKTISNQGVPYMGLDFNVPGSVKYDGSAAWNVLFWCDEALNIRNKMENWIKEIFDDESSTGKYGVPSQEATMDLLDKELKPIRRYNFIGIYPLSLGTIEYDIKGTGAPRTFTCTFAYQFWRNIL
jgi:hypothetical protein